jgi:hypothetical protein
MKGRTPPRRNREEDIAQRRREMIERSITGHGPEAVATRKRLLIESGRATAAPAPAPVPAAAAAPAPVAPVAIEAAGHSGAAVKDGAQLPAQ